LIRDADADGEKGNIMMRFWQSVVKVVGAGLCALVCLTACGVAFAASDARRPEKWYQDQWCRSHDGDVEVILPDRTRCDCLTEKNAVEFDFGKKWAEAVGQALYYSTQTNKKAGIVLIIESDKDLKYIERLKAIIRGYDLSVDVWAMDKNGVERAL
jgi:hypothetical protein